MKQKYLFLTGILGLALVFGLIFAGCDNGNGSGGGTTKTFTVTFDTGDGSGTPPPVQTVEDGKPIFMPGRGNMTAPAGKEFDGWKGDGRNLATGATYTVTKDVMFIAQWKDSGNGPGGQGGNVIQGGISVLPLNTGIRIILDMAKVPSGTEGIQYYIKGPNYNKAVQIWFSLANVPTQLDFPFTEQGSTYTVETQYTMSGGNEPMAATVSVTATGGSGDIMLRNNPSVMYRSSNETVEITPAPDFRKPAGWACTYGLVLYLANDNRAVYITHFNENSDTTALNIREFNYGTSWDGNRPLSQYDNRDVFIEVGYHFATNNGESFKIVIGNTGTFKFPYFP
jgi:hypothetical protein